MILQARQAALPQPGGPLIRAVSMPRLRGVGKGFSFLGRSSKVLGEAFQIGSQSAVLVRT